MTDTTRLRPAIDAVSALRLDLEVGEAAHAVKLPAEQLYTDPDTGQTVRLFFGYGFVDVQWGNRYLNTTGHELDADPFEAFGKRYQHVRVNVRSAQLDEGRASDMDGLTPAATRKVEAEAPAILERFFEENPDTFGQWSDAEARHREAWERGKLKDACAEFLTAARRYLTRNDEGA